MRGPIPRPIRASDELTWVVLWRASQRADGNRKARNAIHELRGVISKLPPEHCNRGIHPAPLLLPAQAKGKKLWRNDDQVTGSRYVIVSLGRSREIKVVSDLGGGSTRAPAGSCHWGLRMPRNAARARLHNLYCGTGTNW